MSGREEAVDRTAAYARKRLSGEGSGHDWWHTYRVWKMARRIAIEEKAGLFIVELAALLHDIDDWKISGDEEAGARAARVWLEGLGKTDGEGKGKLDGTVIDHVCKIISTISFKGANVKSPMETVEGECVQDADRLDAMGAIGIARVFAYGGSKKRPIYDPQIKPRMHRSADEYLKADGSSINHFYEKLLLVKDRMNTDTGKRIAAQRHRFMEKYLEIFFAEWKECEG